MCRPGNATANAAADARAAENERQARTTEAIGRVNETFGQFDDGFFGRQSQAYMDFANPQAEDQYGRARRDLIFALARAGTTNSSTAARRLTDLERDYGLRRQEIADQARGYAQETRANVEQARSNLIAQAQATGDASVAANSALNEANRLRATPTFSPLGALFVNTAAGIGAARNAQDAESVRAAFRGPSYRQPTDSMRTVGG